MSADVLLRTDRYLRGPEFLCEFELPEQEQEFLIDENDPELKNRQVQCHAMEKAEDELPDATSQLLSSHSSWYKLRKSVAWILKFKEFLRMRAKGVDQLCFQEEYASLKSDQTICLKKSSPLYRWTTLDCCES